MLKIIIAETKDFSPIVVNKLRESSVVDLIDLNQNDLASALDYYDVFWFRLGFQLTPDLVTNAKRCKYIVCPVTGLDHIDLEACDASNIRVISLRGEVDFLKRVRATAELTLGLTLALIRKIPQAVRATQSGAWSRDSFKGTEIFEKKIGIIGFGRLGQLTANYFQALGGEITIFDTEYKSQHLFKVASNMDELFQNCDIISVHVNLSKENYHLIGKSQFEKIKNGALFINTSRGQIVDSKSLVAALKTGKLAGAAVDVIENEFDVRNDLLLKYAQEHENLIVTPHIGGNTFESFEKTEMFVAEKLIQLLNSK